MAPHLLRQIQTGQSRKDLTSTPGPTTSHLGKWGPEVTSQVSEDPRFLSPGPAPCSKGAKSGGHQLSG